MDKKTVVLSAGGTGGHLFPAEALAAELLARGHRVVIFTDKRGDMFKSLGRDVEIHVIPASTLKSGLGQKIKAVFNMAAGVVTALFKIIKIRPDIVVGFGGYPSFPGVAAAQLLGKKTLIHEQNAVLGKANAALAGRAGDVAVSFNPTRGISGDKVTVTGNPIRASVVEAAKNIYQPPAHDFKILITGGSQAASVFADVVPKAAALLPEDIKRRLDIMHQCRTEDAGQVEKTYRDMGVKAEVRAFFNDMGKRLGECHLFIGRSGASTVMEAAVTGRPAIFVPLKLNDNQQRLNAEVLSSRGGGWTVLQEDFTPEKLAALIAGFAAEPQQLKTAAEIAKSQGQPDAAKKLADLVEKRIQQGK